MEPHPFNFDKASLGWVAPFGLSGKDAILSMQRRQGRRPPGRRHWRLFQTQRHGIEGGSFRLYPMILLTHGPRPISWNGAIRFVMVRLRREAVA